jgi:surfactin synthase thioesterase subunit
MYENRPLLFCIPHAGGSAAAFQGWGASLGDAWDVKPLELPGRGRRSREPLCEDIQQAARDLAERLSSVAEGQPFAIMGHSLGGTLAYETQKVLHSRAMPRARGIIVAGSPPPGRPRHPAISEEASDDELLRALLHLGGVTSDLLESDLISGHYAPIVRADLRMYSRYRVERPLYTMDCPLLVLLGGSDPLTAPGDSLLWRELANAGVTTRLIVGAGHFLLDTHRGDAATAIAAFLASTQPASVERRSSGSAAKQAAASDLRAPIVDAGGNDVSTVASAGA